MPYWRMKAADRTGCNIRVDWQHLHCFDQSFSCLTDLCINTFIGTVFALKSVEHAITHTPCQLMQLHNQNHAVQWRLGGYCRGEQDFPGAGEEMVNMWVYIAPPSAAPAPVQTLLYFWGPCRHRLLFAVKSVWSLCLFVFYRPIKTPVLHACPHGEAPSLHL